MDTRQVVQELRRLKEQAEMDVSNAIYATLRRFEEDTGVNIISVNVEMRDVTSFMDRSPRYVPQVSIGVEEI